MELSSSKWAMSTPADWSMSFFTMGLSRLRGSHRAYWRMEDLVKPTVMSLSLAQRTCDCLEPGKQSAERASPVRGSNRYIILSCEVTASWEPSPFQSTL